MTMINYSIKCFGVFRQFGEQLNVSVNTGSSVQQIKAALVRQLGEQHKALVEESVLANDNAILPNAYILQEEAPLSILPPVCGG
ncbi:MAG: MoaD/ThiS family protein [Alphaproteobacteria bacterium]|jgi:molybdopterin converting factor small subunit|nr:MoaD/ThiS family protein [Alphaproteobacteria bacterium]